MKFWKTKTWAPLDIACLKWSSLLVGFVIGVLVGEIPSPILWVSLIVAILLAIKPTRNYWRE